MIDRPVAVVTGAAGGIGARCAQRLAEAGHDLMIVDLKGLDATAEICRAAGARVETHRCDLTDSEAIGELGQALDDAYGRCTVLVNNAGFYSFMSIDDMDFAQWREFMSLNFDAAFLMVKTVLPLMRRGSWGRIINMASNGCFAKVPGLTGYIASKSGLIGLTRGLASDLGSEGITANAIAPGPIATDQLCAVIADEDGPEGAAVEGFFAGIVETQSVPRVGMPKDVAAVVAFLASEESAFISGQTIVVDGGVVRL